MVETNSASPRKPFCQLTGEDGNVFNVIALVRRALLAEGQPERAKEFTERAFAAKSYDEVLGLCWDFVDVH